MATITTSLTYSITVLGPLAIDSITLVDYCKGLVYPPTTFTASGGLAPYTWDATGSTLPGGFVFNTSTATLAGTATSSGSFNLHLTVTDSNSNTATTDFPFTIFAPPVITTTSVPDGVYNTVYSTTLSATPGDGTLGTWVVITGSLPGGLTLNSSTGEISGTISSLNGYFPFTVRVTDSNGCYDDKALSINVTPTPLVIDTTSLPGSCRGAAYSQTLSASSGNPPYTWAIISGSLPPSLSLNTGTGEVSGTVDSGATVQVYNFTVEVTDNSSNTAQRPLSIEVYPEPTWVTTTLPNGALTVAYSQQLIATNGDAYTLQSGALPDSLTLSSGGLLSGTPTVANTFNFTIRATSVPGCTADQAFTVIIGNAPPVITGSFGNVCNGVNYYNNSISVSGGTPPYTFYLAGGILPPTLELSSTTGAISGITAGPGTYNFDILVSDSLGLTDTVTFGFTVYDSPVIVTTGIQPGIYGRPYAFSFNYTGGTDPHIWFLQGTLPAGLVFNSIYGTITGTPTEFGYFPVLIGIQDSNGCLSTKRLAVIISGPPVISDEPLPPACQNQEYGVNPPVNINVSGGIAPYYWFIVSNNFPPQDLVLNPYTGQLSGIPLVPGSYLFTVKVVDQNNLYSVKDYVLIVRTEKECGQPDEGKTITVTKVRLSSLESTPVIVNDTFHQKHLHEYLPAPFEIKNE